MEKSFYIFLIILISCNISVAQTIQYENNDLRLVSNGNELPSRTYADQPRVIICDDGSWLAVITTSSGTEGAHMNNIIATKSYDNGITWTDPINLESPGVPQSSWAVPLKVPNGRIYVFYNFNKFRFTGLEGVVSGPFAYRYSDDHGKTWSTKRYEVPIRKTKIDFDNYTNGEHQFFWSIDKPVVTKDAAYITLSKVLRNSSNMPGFYSRAEGFILKSENILEENNPENITWETLPEGDTGIANPEFGKVQAEHNLTVLNNGDLYVVYRTWDGSPAYAISKDGGNTFSNPKYIQYANGERMGNPRACPMIYKTKGGKYLFWYHNNFREGTYDGRNPAWLSGGLEKDGGEIVWSQPEIILYTRDPAIRGMSYPDYIEMGGRLWIAETQKNEARIHEMDLDLLQGMWNQGTDTLLVEEGLIMNANASMLTTQQINFPQLPNLITGDGFSIELWITVEEMEAGKQILSTIGARNKGIEISVAQNNAIEIVVNDGEVREVDISENRKFTSDQNSLSEGKLHHVVFTLDGAAKIATIIVDGVLSDGSPQTRNYGWGRIYPYLKDPNDTNIGTIEEDFDGKIYHMRIYSRALRTSEAIANFHAGF